MNKTLLAFIAFSIPSLALAENIGVEKTNYIVTGTYGTVDFDDPMPLNYETSALSGTATFALGKYGGASAALAYENSNYDNYDLKSTSTAYGASFFVRDASIGQAAIAYTKSNISLVDNDERLTLNSLSLDVNSYLLNLSYYYQDFTIDLTRVNLKTTNIEANTSSLSGTWHAHENLSIGLSIYGMDSKNTKQISLTYQPEFFNRSTSLTFRYLKNNSEIDITTSAIAINYYFDTRVSLKNRERKY